MTRKAMLGAFSLFSLGCQFNVDIIMTTGEALR